MAGEGINSGNIFPSLYIPIVLALLETILQALLHFSFTDKIQLVVTQHADPS